MMASPVTKPTFDPYYGESLVTYAKDLSPDTTVVASMGNLTIGPGETVTVPIKFVYGIKAKQANRYSDDCILHPDKFVKFLQGDLPYLVKRKNCKRHGFILTNHTDKIIPIPDSTKLADVEFTDDIPTYGVANIGAYYRYQETGKTYIPSHEFNKNFLARIHDEANAPKWRPENEETLSNYFEFMKRSKWAHKIPVDNVRLLERMEAIDKGVVFKDDSPMTINQQLQTKILIMCYADLACLDIEDLPTAKVAPMRINTHKHPPIKLKMRPTPIRAREWLKEHIDDLLKGKVIVPVGDSPYGFPLVFASKRDEKFRLCIDFRELNVVTIVNQGPIPLLQDMINNVYKKKFCANIDLTKAYFQLPLAPEDFEKTTFICELGSFMFLKVPFGLAGAVAHYQTVLRDLIAKIELTAVQSIANYIDDVFIGGEEFEDFLDALEKLFEQMRNTNLKFGLKKSAFGVREVKYLGFVANADTWYPDPERIKPLLDRPPPRDLKELRGICSSLAFYKRFLPNSTHILEALFEKLRGLDAKYSKKSRKPISIPSDQAIADAWEDCKKLLQNKIMNWHIDPFKEFHLFVDASDYASGSAIMQYIGEEGNSDLRPVAFHSKVFNPAERNYTTTERELLGVLHALDKYNYIIIGGEYVNIYTDHKSIIALVASKTVTTQRLCRWRRWLSTYKLRWKYIPGKEHELADFLSRPPEQVYKKMQYYIEKPASEESFEYDERFPKMHMCRLTAALFGVKADKSYSDGDIDKLITSFMLEIDNDRLASEQLTDDTCTKIKEILNDASFEKKTLSDLKNDPLAVFAKRCIVVRNVLLCWSDVGRLTLVPVVPMSMRREIIDAAHADKMGHLRNPRLKQFINTRCEWPTMSKDIDKYLQECSVCTNFLAGRHIDPPPAAFMANEFMEQLTIDVFHLGPSKYNMSKCLAIIDTFTRFGWAIPIPDETVESQTKALLTVMQFGVPKSIVADRAPTYTSKQFRDWVISNKITLVLSPGYCANHVTLVNRFHRTLREMLAKDAARISDWIDSLPFVLSAYNGTTHPALGFAPIEVVTGSRPRMTIDDILGIKLKPTDFEKADYVISLEIARVEIRKSVFEKQKQTQKDSLKSYLKSKPKKAATIKVGDRVFRTCAADRLKLGKQAAVRYFGPYLVVSLLDDGVHAEIVREIDPSSKVERIHLKNLVLAKDRVCLPVYPHDDIIKRENDLIIGPSA
jgi:hypothetical protein